MVSAPWQRCAASGCFSPVVAVVARIPMCAGHRAEVRVELGGGASSVVYYLTSDDMATVKIGTSANPAQRLREHAVTMSGTPRFVAAHPGGRQEERSQHLRFRALLLPGQAEVFRAAPELLEHVANVATLWPGWRDLLDTVSDRARSTRKVRL